MIEQDTIRLLRECDKGIKMGISSIEDVYGYAKDEKMKNALYECKVKHERIRAEIEGMLDKYGDEGKNPNPMVKGMSWLKTNMKLAMKESDATIASLMTDGCNMGVKSLSRFLNEYEAAEEKAKDIAKKLISQESDLSVQMRDFL